MTTENQASTAPVLSATEITQHQELAKQEFSKLQQQISPNHTGGTEIMHHYPFGGSFSVTGIGYIEVKSAPQLEFTNGVQLTFKGAGGGLAIGGGVFAGAGLFNVDPTTLPEKEITFAVAAGPGVPAPISITWLHNGKLIGTFSGLGFSAFTGAGGGKGSFKPV
jgi:hypothetical protein